MQESSASFRTACFWYDRGFNVVPRKSAQKKHPAVKWKDLQSRRVTIAELSRWRGLFEWGGVGFITGAISGVIVVETDGPDGEARLTEFGRKNGPLPATLTIRSGSGRGFHRYFVHPGYRVTTRANPEIQIDVKGDGGFCVLPPSRHKSGGLYEVILPVAPAPLPHGLLEFVEAEARSAKVRESPRNASARIVGQANRVASSTSHRARKQPVNRTNVALVQSILDALPDEWVVDFDDWLRVGFALHDFDPGKVGLALWRRFSMRCPQKAAQTDFDDRWESFTRGYDGPSVTLGTLIQAAKASGWRQSCRWDYATYDNRAGSKKRD